MYRPFYGRRSFRERFWTNGIIESRLFEKAKVSPDLLRAEVEQELARTPRVSGSGATGQGLYVTQRDALKAEWDNEKRVIDDIQALRTAIQQARTEMEQALRQGDL